MAQALGYHEDTIRKTFGDVEEDDIKDEFDKFRRGKRNPSIGFDDDQLKLLFD